MRSIEPTAAVVKPRVTGSIHERPCITCGAVKKIAAFGYQMPPPLAEVRPTYYACDEVCFDAWRASSDSGSGSS